MKMRGGSGTIRVVVRKRFLASAVVYALSLACGAGPARAEEGGSGHYLPGSMASFADGVAQTPSFLVRYNLIHYGGSVGAKRDLPIAGETVAGADAEIWGHGLTLFWRPPLEIGEHWSYAVSATIPLLSTDISASAVIQGPGGAPATFPLADSLVGLGDIVLQPLMLNYNVNPDVNVNYRVSLYVPTGSYEVGRLANTGKNFWTVEPTLAFMYLGTKNGRELSVFTGFDFNTENEATDYTSGIQAHVDGTLAQHFPLFGGLAGFGASAYYYQQITGDTGSGAILGGFRATTAGVGPVASYTRKLAGNDFIAELKWLHEYYTKNRLQGDTVLLKVMLRFPLGD
jgi:hypothetical protein